MNKQTLLLISHGNFLNNNLAELLARPLTELKVMHIITAAKGASTDVEPLMENVRDIFRKNNIYFEDYDLVGKREVELRSDISRFNCVFVNGGSVFYLMKAINESGFEKVIKELLPQGFIYIGASAGAYVVCPTIEAATWKRTKNNHGLTNLKAMNLVPFLLSVHYKEEMAELLKEKIDQANYPVHILTDEQAILIKDGKTQFLGEEEIIL